MCHCAGLQVLRWSTCTKCTGCQPVNLFRGSKNPFVETFWINFYKFLRGIFYFLIHFLRDLNVSDFMVWSICRKKIKKWPEKNKINKKRSKIKSWPFVESFWQNFFGLKIVAKYSPSDLWSSCGLLLWKEDVWPFFLIYFNEF